MISLLTLTTFLLAAGVTADGASSQSVRFRASLGLAFVGGRDFRYGAPGLGPGGGRDGLEVFLRAIPALTLAGNAGYRGTSTGIPVTVAGVVGFAYAWR